MRDLVRWARDPLRYEGVLVPTDFVQSIWGSIRRLASYTSASMEQLLDIPEFTDKICLPRGEKRVFSDKSLYSHLQ